MIRGSLDILYIEDDETDVDLVKTAFKYVDDVKINMDVVADGEQAIDYLTGTGSYSQANRPDLILLDLNLPRINGRDVLKAIKANEGIKKIPVVVLSTSSVQRDVDQSYQHGASAYLVKPSDFKSYQDTAKTISEFWFKKAALPSKHN